MIILSYLFSWGPVVLWASLIFYLSNIPSLNSGFGVWDTIFRKMAHIFEFAVLTGLLIRAFRQTWSNLMIKRLLLRCILLAILYAISDEYHQTFVLGRSGQVRDVLIDSVGIGLMVLFYLKRMPRHVSLIVISLILIVGCTPDQKLSRARNLEKKGKFYQAWEKYQEFAATYPKHSGAPEALFHAGWLAQRQLKDCQMAGVFYDGVVEKYPQSDPWARLATHQKNNCPDYFPLLPNFQWVEGDSETQGKNARIETVCKPATEKGALPSEAGLLAKTYFAGATKFKTLELIYKKSEDEIREFTSETDVRPKVIFRLPPQVGARWKTRSGERLFAYEVVAVDKSIHVVAGDFSGCVLIRSSVEGVPGATNEYYAPFVGRILTAFLTPNGEKRNIELLSYKPAPDIDLKSLNTNP